MRDLNPIPTQGISEARIRPCLDGTIEGIRGGRPRPTHPSHPPAPQQEQSIPDYYLSVR